MDTALLDSYPEVLQETSVADLESEFFLTFNVIFPQDLYLIITLDSAVDLFESTLHLIQNSILVKAYHFGSCVQSS